MLKEEEAKMQQRLQQAACKQVVMWRVKRSRRPNRS